MKTQALQFLSSGSMLVAVVFVPLYADQVLGLNRVEIASIAFAYSFMLFCSSYLLGRFSDIYGRHKVLVIGLFASGATMYLHSLTLDFYTLIAARCLFGISLGIFPAALLAYAHEGNNKMGRFTSWGQLGWATVTLVGGAIIVISEERFVFVFASVLLFSGFVIALLLPKKKFTRRNVPLNPKQLLIKNMHFYVPVFVRHSVANAIWTFWPLILRAVGAGPFLVGLIMFVNGGTQFLVMFFISDRVDPFKLFLAGLMISTLTFICIFIAFVRGDIIFMIATQVLLGLSWSTIFAGSIRYLLDNNKEHASATGLFNSTLSVSAITGPILALVIIALGGSYFHILILAFLGAGISIGLHLVLKRINPYLRKDRSALGE